MAKKKAAAEEIKDTNKGSLPEDRPEPAEEQGDVGEATTNPAAEKGAIVVKYRDHQGEVTSRTFSKDVHGPEFKKLADEFKATNAARIVA